MAWYPPGLADDLFIRGDVPITKAEVRALTMAKAWLRDGMRILDIGSGTGSLTVEAALLCPHGEVVAVEREAEALALTRQNLDKFGATNATIVAGAAPAVLDGLAPFDRVFLGGTGGRMAEILAALPRILKPGGRVISNTIGLESTTEVLTLLKQAPWRDWEAIMVSISRGAPLAKLTRFEPLNPVWIVAANLQDTTE